MIEFLFLVLIVERPGFEFYFSFSIVGLGCGGVWLRACLAPGEVGLWMGSICGRAWVVTGVRLTAGLVLLNCH